MSKKEESLELEERQIAIVEIGGMEFKINPDQIVHLKKDPEIEKLDKQLTELLYKREFEKRAEKWYSDFISLILKPFKYIWRKVWEK